MENLFVDKIRQEISWKYLKKDVFRFVLEQNIREVLESESGGQIAEIDHRLEEL